MADFTHKDIIERIDVVDSKLGGRITRIEILSAVTLFVFGIVLAALGINPQLVGVIRAVFGG